MSRRAGDSPVAVGRRLMLGGGSAALAATLVGAVVVWLAVSGRGGLGCVAGGAMAILALVLAQVILTASYKLKPGPSFAVAMGAYGVTIAGVFAAFILVKRQQWLPSFWVGIGVLIGALGYVLGLAITWPKLRIPVFDTPPTGGEQ